MSEENNVKITSVAKPKDPRRVEAGKRLAAISKAAKKKKADATSTLETANTITSSTTDLKELGLIVSVIGIAVGVAGLYYRFKGKSDCVNNSSNEHVDRKTSLDEESKSKPKTNPKTKLDSLD